MPTERNDLDALYCQKVHEAILDDAPVILTLFNDDAFQQDAYLELRYQPERGHADLYFYGIGLQQILNQAVRRRAVSGDSPQNFDTFLQNLNLLYAVHHVRIAGAELTHILHVLEASQGVHFEHSVCGRDGNMVTLKSFWKAGASFHYWCAPVGSGTQIAEVVWLLADYLPRPARTSLQDALPAEAALQLQNQLRQHTATQEAECFSSFRENFRQTQLAQLYASIQQKGTTALRAGNAVFDDYLNRPETDTRMAVALVIRLPESVQQNIRQALDALAVDFPELYYYPADDLHITVLDILRGRPGLEKPSPALLAQYKACLTQTLEQLSPFSIRFKGLTVSDGAILVKGYDDGGLESLRTALRPALKAAGLPLEERYETASCHVTAARFPQKIHDPAGLLSKLESLSELYLRVFKITEVELTYHNWYDSKKECLAAFSLEES